MKTKCYCVSCKNHPLFSQRKKFKEYLTGFEPGHFIMPTFDKQAADVDCLEPESDAFYNYDIDTKDQDFPVTAYGDGGSATGFIDNGITIYAYCGKEEHED